MEFSSDQFRSIIEGLEAQPGDQNDQRKTARVGLTARVTITRSGRKVSTVTMRDLSPGGVGLMSREPFGPDEKFIVHLPRRDEPPQFVLCAVRHCQSVETDLFMVGAQFISISQFKEVSG